MGIPSNDTGQGGGFYIAFANDPGIAVNTIGGGVKMYKQNKPPIFQNNYEISIDIHGFN